MFPLQLGKACSFPLWQHMKWPWQSHLMWPGFQLEITRHIAHWELGIVQWTMFKTFTHQRHLKKSCGTWAQRACGEGIVFARAPNLPQIYTVGVSLCLWFKHPVQARTSMAATIGIHERLWCKYVFSCSGKVFDKWLKRATTRNMKHSSNFKNTFITCHKILLAACDKEAIDPETMNSIFFGTFIIINGAVSDADNMDTPKKMACFWGGMSKFLPEAV